LPATLSFAFVCDVSDRYGNVTRRQPAEDMGQENNEEAGGHSEQKEACASADLTDQKQPLAT
jgi:hypothetical protein